LAQQYPKQFTVLESTQVCEAQTSTTG